MINSLIKILSVSIGIFLLSCNKEIPDYPKREFKTSFESENDFSEFYITPQGYLETTYHELSDSIVHTGTYAHKAWVNGANPPSTTFTNNNHRGYPTIQLYKTEGGSFKTPCYVTFWVWLDMELKENPGEENDWFSLATFSDAEDDNWNRTVLVNLSYDGIVHLMHVPKQGDKEHIFQTSSITFPQKEWVELKIYLDFSNNGYAKVWQNGELISHAEVKRTKELLAQLHFGMYCPPQMESGIVYNDDLVIKMVENE